MQKTLVIGKGEVGVSLFNVLKKVYYDTYIKDVEPIDLENIDVLNICFPYSDKFEEYVKEYQTLYNPKLTIIHSTVPVGTSRKLGAVHSPIHGKHPNLEQGILTFVKYVGCDNRDRAFEASKFLARAGIVTKVVKNAETSEMSKIYCTTQYGLNIVLMKEMYAMCEKYDADFDEAYKQWNKNYNDGYSELGMPQFRRYFLDHNPGKIGGHCVINNAKLLQEESEVAKFILKKDEQY